MTEPTDAEIEATWADVTGSSILPYPDDMRAFARAALAKWGTLRAEKIVIPTDTMEQEFQKHYQRGYAAGQKASATQPTQAQAGAVPLTLEVINAMAREYPAEDLCGWSYIMGVADAERHHGIKGGQHGTE